MRKLSMIAWLMMTVLLLASSPVSAQMHDFGTISGLVTDQATTDPINHAMVAAFRVDGNPYPVAQAFTDETGNYELHLRYGDYFVAAGAWGYALEWWQEVDNRDSATALTVGDGSNPTGIDFTLAAGLTDSGSIAGTVYDFDTSAPIVGAQVSLRKADDYHFHRMVTTGDDGTYLFGELPPGQYLLHSVAEGYMPADYPDPVSVDGDAVTDIDFYLQPLVFGSIAGYVFDADSVPIEGARVTAHMSDPHPHGREAYSGADGSYIIEDVLPGEYTVHAGAPGFQPQDYPTPVVVNGDDITGIDFYLEPIVMGGISGVVTDAGTGDPIARAFVLAIQTGFPYHHRWTITNENGEYLMEMPSGTYHVRVWAFGYLTGETDEPIVVVDEVVTGVNFALTPLVFGSISGTVYSADSLPISHAVVDARLEGGHFHMTARTNENGEYTINYLVQGSYLMRAFARDYQPQTLEDPIAVNGDEITGIDFYLQPFESPFDGTISGYVTDENSSAPIANAHVVAIAPGHFDMRFIRRTHTDENGYYLFENLPDINFKVAAMAADYIPEFYDEKTNWWDADPVMPDAENINFDLTPIEVDLMLISGRVIEAGQPVDGAVVMALAGDEVVNLTVSYPDGIYYLENMAPGEYTIEIISPSETEGSIDAVLAYEDIFDADVVLSPTAIDDDVAVPQAISLHQNYPNPFNATTNIRFVLPNPGQVELSIYDILGRRISTLFDGNLSAGTHTFTWNGVDQSGNPISTGMYLYVLKTADETFSNRMLLLK